MSQVQLSHQKKKGLIRKRPHLRPILLKKAPKPFKHPGHPCSRPPKEILQALLAMDKTPVAFSGQIIHRSKQRNLFICSLIKRVARIKFFGEVPGNLMFIPKTELGLMQVDVVPKRTRQGRAEYKSSTLQCGAVVFASFDGC